MPTRYYVYVPRSLREPAGLVFLHPSERVSRRELERRDAQWRAKRDAEAARSWAEDATLVEYSPYWPRPSSSATSVASSGRRNNARSRRRNVATRIGRGLGLRQLKGLFSGQQLV